MPSLIVSKDGGENACRFRTIADDIDRIRSHGSANIRVVSALRTDTFNTTERLIQTGNMLHRRDVKGAHKALLEVCEFHHQMIREYVDEEPIEAQMHAYVNKVFESYLCAISSYEDWFRTEGDYRHRPVPMNNYSLSESVWDGEKRRWKYSDSLSLLALGEHISAQLHRIFSESYLEDGGQSALYPSETMIFNIDRQEYPKPFQTLISRFAQTLRQYLEQSSLIFVPGYTGSWQTDGGVLEVFGRGYSDATAGAVAVASQIATNTKASLHINKQSGVRTGDPKIIADTSHVACMDYQTLGELIHTRNDAKFLNKHAFSGEFIRLGIPLEIGNRETGEVTHVHREGDSANQNVCTSVRPNISLLTITHQALSQPHMLEKITACIPRNMSIRMSGDSELTISFALTGDISDAEFADIQKNIKGQLDDPSLDQIVCDVGASMLECSEGFNTIQLSRGHSIVSLTGQNMPSVPSMLGKITGALGEAGINCEMISHAHNPRSIGFVIRNDDAVRATQLLHSRFSNITAFLDN